MPTLSRAPTREYATVVMDSHRWDGFKPRADDIVIATFSKSGTTWMQRIVDLLVFQSPEPRPVMTTAAWLDATFIAPLEDDLAKLESQTHRRFVKSHLPFDSLPVWDEVKYIHVVRDGRDAALSMHNHQRGMVPEVQKRFEDVAQSTGRANTRAPEVPADAREYFLRWIKTAAEDGSGGGDVGYFEFENTYWRERSRENLLFVHYIDLKKDLDGEMRRIAAFLGIRVPETLWPVLVGAATFESMRRDGDALMSHGAMLFDQGARRFLYKGANERWRGVLTNEDLANYEALAARFWTAPESAFMHSGRAAGDPREM